MTDCAALVLEVACGSVVDGDRRVRRYRSDNYAVIVHIFLPMDKGWGDVQQRNYNQVSQR